MEDDYNEFDDYEGEDTVRVYTAEANAYSRVGHGGRLTTVISEGPMKDIQQLADMTNPEEKFLILLTQSAQSMIEKHDIKISDQDIEIMADKVSLISDIQYKNPTAFILGYIATQPRKNMNNVKHVINHILPKIEEGGVKPPDVVRYSRFWLTLS